MCQTLCFVLFENVCKIYWRKLRPKCERETFNYYALWNNLGFAACVWRVNYGGGLNFPFFFPASTCHAALLWNMVYFYQKKKCNDDKLEIIRLFHGLHVKQKIKSSNPLFGLFVSFLNCVYYLVFYMYHSMVIVSNLYFHVNFIS